MLTGWFQPWNMEGVLWWCGVQYLPMDWGFSLSWGGIFTGNHYRSILTDHLHLCFRLSFRKNIMCFKMTTPLFTLLAVFKHEWAWWWSGTSNLVSSVPSSQYHWAFVEFFKEQSPGSVSSSTHSIWIRGGHAWGMGVNFDELCSRPLFVNPTSNVSCHSGQRCPNPLLNKIFHFFHRCFYYFVLYLYIPMVYWLSSVRVISFRNKQISLCPWI